MNKILSLMILLGIFISCAVNPVTGKREFMLVTESDEIAMGKQYDPQISQMYGVYEDKKLSNYVNDLGQRMAKISHRPNLNYNIKVMDSPVINAFAVPGGYVYITRGILGYLNSEAELAGVMGHEIGHVTARHSAKQQSKAQLAQIGLGLGSIFVEGFDQFSGLAGQAVGLMFLKFGRDDERQSDELGVEYSTRIGYDSNEMSNFFNVLDKMHSTGTNSLPDFLSTHPNPDERVVNIKKLTDKEQKENRGGTFIINREEYLKQIDGIIFGPDPRQGFVEDNVFYHPELKFQFPTPVGWTVNNLPSQVQMVAADENGLMIFKLETVETHTQAAASFISESKITIVSRNVLKVNGLDAEEVIGTLNTQNGQIKLITYFIKKDKNVYSFLGYSIAVNFENYLNSFTNTMTGFKKLSDNNKLSRQPDRIKVMKVSGNATLREAFLSLGVANEDLDQHALLNGAKDLNEKVMVNTLLKVIVKG